MVTTRRRNTAHQSQDASDHDKVDEPMKAKGRARARQDPSELSATSSKPRKGTRAKRAADFHDDVTAPKDRQVPAKGTTKKQKAGETATLPVSMNDEDSEEAILSDEQLTWYSQFVNGDEEYFKYMKTEWGFERRGDESMFEKLCLEGAQSGLSWLTILRKREAYRRTFHNFDIDKVAAMTADDVQAIIDSPTDKGSSNHNVVVRHRGKIEAVINNAKCIQEMRKNNDFDAGEYGVFDTFLWSFVDDKPILNTQWDGKNGLSGAPGKSDESLAMIKALKKLGFKFVGPTTCYSFMQSEGMVIDHPVGSQEWKAALKRLQERPGGFQERGKN